MKKEDALSHFGGVVELARALGVRPQAISQWGETIPQGRSYQIESLTGGKLKASPTEPGSKRIYKRIAEGAKPQNCESIQRAIATSQENSSKA